jgi:hypothetical protein
MTQEGRFFFKTNFFDESGTSPKLEKHGIPWRNLMSVTRKCPPNSENPHSSPMDWDYWNSTAVHHWNTGLNWKNPSYHWCTTDLPLGLHWCTQLVLHWNTLGNTTGTGLE